MEMDNVPSPWSACSNQSAASRVTSAQTASSAKKEEAREAASVAAEEEVLTSGVGIVLATPDVNSACQIITDVK